MAYRKKSRSTGKNVLGIAKKAAPIVKDALILALPAVPIAGTIYSLYQLEHGRRDNSQWLASVGCHVVDEWARRHPKVHIDRKMEDKILQEYHKRHPDVELYADYIGQKIEW